jgi:hypothetical protein
VLLIKNYNRITADRKVVINELSNLKEIINSEDFSIDNDLFLVWNNKNGKTLLELDYNAEDVVEELLKLNVDDYSHSLPDEKNNNPPYLHVFGRIIKEKEIYIKLKVRTSNEKRIICISFHYPEHTINYPYK